MEKRIFMNGKPTTLENIFDAVNPGSPNAWFKVSSSDIGRSITEVLDEWTTHNSTYYYLHGIRTSFELKA